MVDMAFCISFLLSSLFFTMLSHCGLDFLIVNLSHPVIVLVSIPFLSGVGGQNPNNPFHNLLSWGVMEGIEIVEGR